MQGSPGMSQSTGKFDQGNPDKGNGNTLVNSFANGSMMSGSTAVPGGSAQKGQTNYLTFGSPEKSNTKNAQRRGSQARSGRSNSSRDSSGGGHRRRSVNRSANKRSYSTDPDSTERSFVYPCQAFKQFLLTVREGKIDMKDLQNSPFLMDYLAMQAQMGGGSGGADSKPFHQSLRQQTKPTSNGRRNSSNSRSRDANNAIATHGKSQHSGLRNITSKPNHSIVEEMNEEEANDIATVSTQNQLYGKSPNDGNRFSNAKSSKVNDHQNNRYDKSRSPIKHNFNNSNSSPNRPSKVSNQSNVKDNNSISKDRTAPNKQRVNEADNHRNTNVLNKAGFKEDQQQQQLGVNNRPSSDERSSQLQKNLGGSGKVTNPNLVEQNDQVNQPSGKKQRRGRLDRSTSGDERNTIHVNLNDSQEEIRFDEKGRPITVSKQTTASSPMKTSKLTSLTKDKSSLNQPYKDNEDDNNGNSLNNSFQGKNKNRRGRKDRGSSGSEEFLNQEDDQVMNPLQSSPFEPRSVSKLPKPTMKEQTPQRSVQKLGTFNASNPNAQLGQITEGTFRDYQHTQEDQEQDQQEEEDQANSRIPIFQKNTDFITDEDYRLNAFKNQDEQPKKFLKSRASPLKKHQFKEDEDQSVNEYQVNQQKDEDEDQNEQDQFDDEEIQSERGHLPTKQEDASKIGLSMVHKKSPSREKRKVKAGNNSSNNLNNLSGVISNTGANSISHVPYNIGNLSSQGDGIFGDNPAAYFDSRNQNIDEMKGGQDSQRSQKFREFLEEQKQQQSKSRQSNISGVIGGGSGYSLGGQPNEEIVGNRGERSNRFTNLDNSLTKDITQDQNNTSTEKKQRRGRRNRSGRQSSDSQERNAFPRTTSQLDGIHSRTQDYRQNQSPDQHSSYKPNLNMSLTKLSDRPLTIEEHIDTYRSKISSQLIKSARKDYYEDGYGDDYQNMDGDIVQDQELALRDLGSEYYKVDKDAHPNKDYSTKHKNQGQSPAKGNNANVDQTSSKYQEASQSPNKSQNKRYSPSKGQDQSQSPNKGNGRSPTLQNTQSPNQTNANVNNLIRDSNASPTLYQQYSNQQQTQDLNNNMQYQEGDPSNEYSNDGTLSSHKKQRRGRKSRDKSNDSSMYQSQPNQYQQQQYQDDAQNQPFGQSQQKLHDQQQQDQYRYYSSPQQQDKYSNKQSPTSHQQRSGQNQEQYNNDRPSYLNEDQKQTQQMYNNQSYQERDKISQQFKNNNSPYHQQRGSPNVQQPCNQPNRDYQQQERVSAQSYQQQQQNQYSPYKQQQSASNQKSSPNVSSRQQRVNSKQEEQKFTRQTTSKVTYKSRVKELEDQLRNQVLQNPTKPLDYRLIQELQEEAARTIQMKYKSVRKQRKEEDEVKRHGNLCDRKVQTDPVNLYKLAAGNDMDKFKKFFFAVYYTYMMLNTIMADSFKRQQ